MSVLESSRFKIAVIAGSTALTLGIHYGWIIDPLFGHVHWLHSIHGRFCYIPIVIASAWFGLRGGLVTATAISLLLIPFLFSTVRSGGDLTREVAEVVFYFAIAVLIGALVDRELGVRRMRDVAQGHVERSQKLSLVGQVAAGVAHEIKNPLASIKGAADILTDDSTSQEEREEFKEILQNEVKRIDATVGEFLEFARPKPAKLEPMDLSETLRSTLRQMAGPAQRDGVSLATDVEDNVIVDGDKEKLHQLAINLVLNAVQASGEGNTVRVTLRPGDRHARLEVADTGAGIVATDLDRIFEPFFTTRSSGVGLGLAVVKSIVEAHDGRITITSRTGKGTSAVIELPLKKGA